MGVNMTKEMKKSTLNKRDWVLKDTPNPILNETRLKVDDASHICDYAQMLEEQLGRGKTTLQWMDESKNPTDLFTSCKPDVTVGLLIDRLHEMELPQAAKVLEDWVSKP